MSRDEISTRVLDIFRQHTLYPADQLGLDKELEGELGVDSVILQSIVADVERSLDVEPNSLNGRGVRTIRDLVQKAAALAEIGEAAANASIRPGPEPTVAPPAEEAEPPAPRPPVVRQLPAPPELTLEELKEQLGRAAGVAPQEIGPGRTFLSLGLTRTAQDQLLSRLLRRAGVAPALRLSDCDTLEKLGTYLSAASRQAAPQLAPGEAAASQETAPGEWDGRSMKDFVEQRDPDLFAKTRGFGRFFRSRQRENLYWYGMPLESACRNRAVIYDEVAGRRREFLMFASNNYLGLANHPSVIEAVCDATQRYGSTNTGCRLIGGTNVLHKELERRLARFKGTEACIIYPSGYSANLGAISALVRARDTILVDKFNHMSIVDGCRLSGGQRKIYGHNDMQDLERLLASCDGADGKLIVTDGVFSMHGDICDLPEIVRLARRYGARVLVDDAHSTGVLGRRGSGTAEHFGLEGGKDVDLEVGTMSKTLAGVGGFVCADEEVVEYLRFYSNSYVFAANIPAGVAAGLIASLEVMEAEPERVTQLWQNVRRLKSQVEELGFDTGGANSAIVPIVIGDDRKTLEMGRAVRARGLFCQTVVFPGVSLGDARLRISVSSEHTAEDLDLAVEILEAAARETGVLPAREERRPVPRGRDCA